MQENKADILSDFDYAFALAILKKGGIVAYPTETFYGLAVDPENSRAIDALYTLKKRERNKTFSLIVPDIKVLHSWVSSYPQVYDTLISTFWPGPLTLIFSGLANRLTLVKDQNNTLAIRISSHPVAQKLVELWGKPLTASSANISGESSCTEGSRIEAFLGHRKVVILNGGSVCGGKGSTIVSCRGTRCNILRKGVISTSSIKAVLPNNYTICKK